LRDTKLKRDNPAERQTIQVYASKTDIETILFNSEGPPSSHATTLDVFNRLNQTKKKIEKPIENRDVFREALVKKFSKTTR